MICINSTNQKSWLLAPFLQTMTTTTSGSKNSPTAAATTMDDSIDDHERFERQKSESSSSSSKGGGCGDVFGRCGKYISNAVDDFYWPRRHTVIILQFIGMCFVHAQRVNMGVAVVSVLDERHSIHGGASPSAAASNDDVRIFIVYTCRYICLNAT